ncbi:methyltransferase family protein [Anaeromyxobacter terrae]|uniref:methyltransferase family protein n=1 Tax=Anaeromyxobacter terrae TaxID=2925406 RepID=UPI001F58159C|nr:isoprenylcysteine carboxylmethyltransferase family protein [Anaeromyxobacter sp. SG22]
MSGDLRLVALAALGALAAVFLGGVRRVFRRPEGPHRYRASLVSGLVLAVESAVIALTPVPPARLAAALVLFALSLGLFLWAARVNRERPLLLAFAAHVPEHLQTRGPYLLVRHPFYASYLLAFAGGLVAAGTAWLLPLFGVGFYTYWQAAAREERGFAASPLAGAHREYAERVGMFVPRLSALLGRRG